MARRPDGLRLSGEATLRFTLDANQRSTVGASGLANCVGRNGIAPSPHGTRGGDQHYIRVAAQKRNFTPIAYVAGAPTRREGPLSSGKYTASVMFRPIA